MNIELLQKTKEQILKGNIPVVMDCWYSVREEDYEKNWDDNYYRRDGSNNWIEITGKMHCVPDAEGKAEHGCGTACCIAGHALIAAGYDRAPSFVGSIAAKLLDLNRGEEARLFYVHNWPEDLEARYRALNPKEGEYSYQSNELAAERIDRFIASGGDE